jgi:hypothetical protein
MLSGPKPKLLLSILVLAAILILPAAAHATLAFVKYGHYPLSPYVFTASDNGLEEARVGRGYDPKVSPNGASVAYINEQRSSKRRRLRVVPARGGDSNQLLDAAKISFVTWSPNSKAIAAVRAPRQGRPALVLIDVATGGQTTLARGHFTGISFSPDSTELAYSRINRPGPRPGSDIFRVSIGGPHSLQRLTFDHRSAHPVWGVGDQIAFVKELGSGHREQLFGMNSEGGGVYRLVPRRSYRQPAGIVPVDWSQNGRLLLANVRSQRSGFKSGFALLVEPGTHAQWPALPPSAGFLGTSFSCDGHRVLGSRGTFHPVSNHLVGTVASDGSGGHMSVLGRFAFEPDWGACGKG